MSNRKKIKHTLLKIYNKALACHAPHDIVFKYLKKNKDKFSDIKQIEIISTGKSAMLMANGATEYFGEKIKRGLIISPDSAETFSGEFELIFSSHPYPDKRSLEAGQKLLEFCESSDKDSLLIYLLSGGTSSLVISPAMGISLDEKIEFTKILMNNGIEISDLNLVRKFFSNIKGGKLLNHINNSNVLNLIISDVLTNDVNVIGSGILQPQQIDTEEVLGILRHFGEPSKNPVIGKLIELAGKSTESTLPDKIIDVETQIIDSNSGFQYTIGMLARENDYTVIFKSDPFTGPVDKAVPAYYLACKDSIKSSKRSNDMPFIIIAGAETSVIVNGNGIGGRNCEFAMRFAKLIEGKRMILLSAGTDGKDGVSDAAGGIVDGKTLFTSNEMGIDFNKYLQDNDSANYLDQVGCLVKTGVTGLNLTDILILCYY
jgi:glycerate-2-kinase